MIRAGPWSANVGSLHRTGWEVTLLRDVRRASDVFRLFNKRTQMCGEFMIDSYIDVREFAPEYYYFPEDMVLSSEIGMVRHVHTTIYGQFDSVAIGEPISPMMDQWHIFSAPKEDDSLILTRERIPEALEMIRALQEPEAKELFHRQRQRGELQVKARLFSYG